ncbi:hypothetical protein [Seonamhaeicola sp.]|uniref:hypothetical protein n=1 Tax=Seonamhaeicola sp. TaxID=1912245 RepID=UPI00263864FB|nr:hypothetical protein [Seonamhaeicola sp.]
MLHFFNGVYNIFTKCFINKLNKAFKNIEIIDNTFNQFDNLILQITNTDGLKFTGNTITNSGTSPMLHADNPAIKIEASKNILLENKSDRGNSKVILECAEGMPEIQFN